MLRLASFLLACLALSGCGNQLMTLAECPADTDPDRFEEAVCAPLLEVYAAEADGYYRFWGTMSGFPPGRPFTGGVVSTDAGRRVEVSASGAFAIDSLRAGDTIRFSADGHREIVRSVGVFHDFVNS